MVFEKMKQILADQLDADIDSITLETDIQDDLGADSLDVVEMLMSIEDEFDIEIPDEQIENLKTVGQVVDYITENMN
ncbi:MAG: acyl carrier protein [Acutalibacteraceae bacterium]|nr:acyl carrier protein [Acutalibacteraceae bacterium]